MADLSPAQRAVLWTGLRPPDPPIEVAETDLASLCAWAQRERLGGLLWHAFSTGELRVDTAGERPEVPQRIVETHMAGLRASLAAEATAVLATRVLSDAGVDCVVFKGVANAHLDYPDPGMRQFFDADVLVRRRDLGVALDALLAAGFTREVPALRRWWELRYARAVPLRSPDGVELDLHAAIAEGYFGIMLDHDALIDGARAFVLGGSVCRSFPIESRIVASCHAVVLSRGPGLRNLRDFSQQILPDDQRWTDALATASESESVLARALAILGGFSIEHPSMRWARDHQPPARALRAIAYADQAHRDGWRADALSAIRTLAFRDKLLFAVGASWPRGRARRRGNRMVESDAGFRQPNRSQESKD